MEPSPSRANLRFYAELNDHLPRDRRYRTLEKSFFVPGPVKDIIESFGVPHPEVELIIANGESVPFSYVVRDGDRIAVYPMFESFDVTPELKVRRDTLREPRFVLDVHLGRLAAYLRMLGFDAVYRNCSSDSELVRVSTDRQRILLTNRGQYTQIPIRCTRTPQRPSRRPHGPRPLPPAPLRGLRNLPKITTSCMEPLLSPLLSPLPLCALA